MWWTAPRSRASRGVEVREFVESYCRATKDTIASSTGELLVLRAWQRRLVDALYSTTSGRLTYRQALVGMPRKNGKSALGASLGLHGLYLGGDGAEVYSVAGDREQARVCFGVAKRMVELDAELSSATKIFRDALEHTDSGSVYRVLSSEAPLKEGLSPTLVVFDELHVQPDAELWSVMTLGSGARREALVLGITTAGPRRRQGRPSLCLQLYEYGVACAEGRVDDPRFFFGWWGAPAGSDMGDGRVWRRANPGYDDIVAADDFASSLPPKVPEHEFRAKRLNQWVDAEERGWLADHPGAWERCRAPALRVEDASRVAMAVDMSLRHDSTAVVTAGRVGTRTVVRARVFRAPAGGKIDFGAVESYVRDRAAAVRPSGIVYDPRFFELIAQRLADDGLPVVEMPQSPERMIPAAAHCFDAIVGGVLAHDGDAILAEHVQAAVWRETERGRHLSKGRSKRQIDAAVALVMAVWELEQPATVTAPAGYVSLSEV